MVLIKHLYSILLVTFLVYINYSIGILDDSTIHCLRGPDFWCLNETTELLCNFSNKTIGLCGYTNKRCQIKTGDEFCKSSPPAQQQPPLEFNGGLTGVDDDYFSYYILSLYWPPSSCPQQYNETKDFLGYFCSPYTDLNQPGRERLALHGLWPTFSTGGDYQGWPQFCSSEYRDWSKCHINGNLCPWTNTSRSDFSQGNYEYCLSKENITDCLVNGQEILEPERERLKILAPGYLNKYNLFVNHEWTKHGSCCSTSFGHNISNYLTHMLDLADIQTRPGSLTYEHIQRYAGEKIGLSYLISLLNQTTIINCNNKCELEEVWMCMSRHQDTGLPNQLMPCPLGAFHTSNSCEKSRCEYVYIPLRSKSTFPKETTDSDLIPTFYSKILLFVFILMFVKFLVVFCGGCYAYFLSY